MSVTYETLNERLLEVVPALTAQYEELATSWIEGAEDGDDELVGVYIVYEDLFCPYLDDLLRKSGNEPELTRLFTFIEELAQHPDKDIVNGVEIGVVGYLLGNFPHRDDGTYDLDLLDQAIHYMGPMTRQITYRAAESYRPKDDIRRLLHRSQGS